ncbi:NLI interacting factor-like phosphatase (macronuclear) [Tetrahymena thermophila SB210]|uniref:protein-serine/threonine phosphatase n=1 Tax=Tetrahymena thermophila (strain SB210) TaxID=312017 RepID=I7LVC3_TETTS|nr:NLI interacting factor-like phosphatase [Tetrahymena thermophila SB210]EAR97854.1 NLI interacting factor-like phosphatase [Tetrahymena thermophila SB210]|eukprot:XP_001018099.1 NLI interacting factor-like phosphatase [Tetrahymena thermophila SB210]
MLSEKVKIYCRGDDRDYLISQVIVRRNNVQISSVQFNAKTGDWVEKGQELGKLICSDGSEKVIKINLKGTIDQINQNITLNAPSFSLCNINICGHDELNHTELQHMFICSKCSEEVWIYRDKSVGLIVAQNLSDFNSSKRLDHKDKDYEIKFSSIKKNEILQPKSLLFEAELCSQNSQSDSESEDESEKIQFNLNEVIYIKDINYNYNNDRSWILKYEKVICSHQKIDQNNSCVYCYQDLPKHTNKVYAGLDQKDKSVLIGKEYAEYSKKLAHQQLHSNQKLILVLDLDNTILHAVPAIKNALFDNADGIQQDSFKEFHNRYSKYVIKFRPYMKEFLQTVLPHYEIYIFTMAMLDYAKCVCDYLKQTYKDILDDYPMTFNYDRIISREQFSSNNKDLQQILPNSEKIMLILDDRDDVWAKNKMNLVTTLPYIYWWEGSDSFNEQAFKAIDQIYVNRANYHRQLSKNFKKSIKSQSQTPANDGTNGSKNSDSQNELNDQKSLKDSTQEANSEITVEKQAKQSEKSQNSNQETNQEEQSDKINSSQDKTQQTNEQDSKTQNNKQEIRIDEENQKTEIENQDSSNEDKQNETTENQGIPENEEKMDLEQDEQNQLGDQSEQQITQEYPSFNQRESEMDLQIDSVQLEEQTKAPNQTIQDEQKNQVNQNPQSASTIFLEEKKYRPKYKEQILNQYNNYTFWKTNQSLQYKLTVIKKTDNYLLFAAPILVHLKNKYYEESDESKRDIRQAFSYYTSQILKGVKILVSSVIRKDKNETAENNIICQRFQRMGGTLVEKLKNDQEIHYLVIGSSPRKDKLSKAIEKNIPIISYKWIEYCWYYNYKFDIQIFEVNKTDFTFKKNDQLIQQELFDKYQNLISI